MKTIRNIFFVILITILIFLLDFGVTELSSPVIQKIRNLTNCASSSLWMLKFQTLLVLCLVAFGCRIVHIRYQFMKWSLIVYLTINLLGVIRLLIMRPWPHYGNFFLALSMTMVSYIILFIIASILIRLIVKSQKT